MAASHWRRYVGLGLTLGWVGLLSYLSSQSDPLGLAPGTAREAAERTLSAQVIAIVAHFVAFGILALLVRWSLAHRRPGLGLYGLALGITMLLAIGDELHRGFTPHRAASAFDVGVDGAGALAALGLWTAAARIVPWRPFQRGLAHSP